MCLTLAQLSPTLRQRIRLNARDVVWAAMHQIPLRDVPTLRTDPNCNPGCVSPYCVKPEDHI